MIALAAILRHRITWGVGIALGVLAAVCLHGALRYREGVRDGTATAQAAALQDAALARRVADSTQAALRTAVAAATARADSLRRVAHRHTVRAEVTQFEAVAAIATYRADTASHTPVASTLASTCEAALAAAKTAREAAEAATAADRVVIDSLTKAVATEPQRTEAAVTQALTTQRATFRAPSRLTWATLGAALGTITTLVTMGRR